MSNDDQTAKSCCATPDKPVQASDCHTEKPAATSGCCVPASTSHTHEHSKGGCCDTDSRPRFDWILWGSAALVAVGYLAHATGIDVCELPVTPERLLAARGTLAQGARGNRDDSAENAKGGDAT